MKARRDKASVVSSPVGRLSRSSARAALLIALAVLTPANALAQVTLSDVRVSIGSDIAAKPLYVRGTGLNNPTTRLVRLGDTVLVEDDNEGLTLTILDSVTHGEVSSTNYDTAVSPAMSDALATALDAMDSSQIGVLTSHTEFEQNLTPSLRTAAFRLGLLRLWRSGSGTTSAPPAPSW